MSKEKVQTSIVIVVLFDGSSSDAYKIAQQRIDGSTVTLTTLAAVTRAGTNFIKAQDLIRMLKTNGPKEIEQNMENGNE